MYSLTQRGRLYSLFAVISLGLFWCPSGLAEGEVNCPGKGKVCRVIATNLPMRAWSRPMSTLYSAPDTGSKVIASNIKAFWSMYVFERRDVDFSDPAHVKGWYKVGTMARDPWAWMQAKDVFEWKYPFVVSYTHPGTGDWRRKPVLMFRTKEALANIVASNEREMRAGEIYEGLNVNPPDVPDSVISQEPTRFVNIEENFYMLPVIDFEMVDLFLEEARYLQITMATALVDYLGKESTPPKFLTAWVLDRDLTVPDDILALEMRVLLKKSDLNDLIQALEMVQTAMKRGIITQEAYFDALQGVVAIACSSSQKKITMDNAISLADTGLLPAWIESLPYRSEILSMSDDMFESMVFEERAHFEESMDAKLELYRKIHENTDLWVALDERDASVDYVYPLPLSTLP